MAVSTLDLNRSSRERPLTEEFATRAAIFPKIILLHIRQYTDSSSTIYKILLRISESFAIPDAKHLLFEMLQICHDDEADDDHQKP